MIIASQISKASACQRNTAIILGLILGILPHRGESYGRLMKIFYIDTYMLVLLLTIFIRI
jgi:hypothetical protein